MNTSYKSALSTSEKYLLKKYISEQLQMEMGKEEFNDLHYLLKEKLIEEYEAEHWNELRKRFPRVSL